LTDLEFYPTPDPFTRWLFHAAAVHRVPIVGRCAELMCGDGAIMRAAGTPAWQEAPRSWISNDLDPRWEADYHLDATRPELYEAIGPVDWHVGNPAFSIALPSIERAIGHARVGVAMHLRASIHEVLKTGDRRTWMKRFTPSGILWLPRFGYQRSKKTNEWSTDSVCACWVIWLKDPAAPQFIDYAPTWMLDELNAFTPTYRRRMDALMAPAALA
jgi:hypothetical protein